MQCNTTDLSPVGPDPTLFVSSLRKMFEKNTLQLVHFPEARDLPWERIKDVKYPSLFFQSGKG
jgi:hypothetical protein